MKYKAVSKVFGFKQSLTVNYVNDSFTCLEQCSPFPKLSSSSSVKLLHSQIFRCILSALPKNYLVLLVQRCISSNFLLAVPRHRSTSKSSEENSSSDFHFDN